MPTETFSLEGLPFPEACKAFATLARYMKSPEAYALEHSALEESLRVDGLELLRLLLQGHLDDRAPSVAEGPVVGADGIDRTHHRPGGRALESIFGQVTARRMGYSAHGVESLYPLDAELNLPLESYSHGVRRRLAIEASKGSFEEAIVAVEAATAAHVPKRQAMAVTCRAAADFTAFYEAQAAHTGLAGEILVLTLDGKGIVMRLEDLREPTRKAAKKRKHHLDKRLSPGEKRNAKRMATVAAVYTIVPHLRTPEQVVGPPEGRPTPPRPENKRVWASVERPMDTVVADAFAEADRRDPNRQKHWVALVDGNEQQIKLLVKQGKAHGVLLTLVLDLIHVLERLWKAAFAFYDKGSKAAEEWVSERLLRLLKGESSQVAAGIRRSATLRSLSKTAREAVDNCCDYLLAYRDMLCYDEYLSLGLPIATGVIEGACRHLIKDRMDLTGARWSLKGAEAVLQLRSLRSSGDFDAYWDFHLRQEHTRNHAVLYAAPVKLKRPISGPAEGSAVA